MLVLLLACAYETYSFKEHLPAMPANPERFAEQNGTVSIAGTVEVPLRSLHGDPRPFVEVTLEDGSKHLMLVAAESSLSFVDEAFAKAAGGKVKKKHLIKGLNLNASSVSFNIGGAAFSDVKVLTTEDWSEAHPAGWARNDWDPLFEGVIGLAGFPELAGAILPSLGVIRLAPAGQGAGLVSGAMSQMPYSLLPSREIKYGAMKVFDEAAGLVVAGKIDGKDAQIQLGTGYSGNGANKGLGVAGADPGVDPTLVATFEVGGFTADLIAHEMPSADWGLAPRTNGVIGAWVTGAMDLAWDPSGGTLWLGGAAERKSSPWYPDFLAEQQKALEPAPSVEGEEPPPAPKPQDLAPVWASIGDAQWALGNHAEARKAYEQAAALDPQSCAMQQEAGAYLLNTGHAADALPYLKASAELFSAWDALSLEERNEIQEEKAKVEGGKKLFGKITVREPGTWEGQIPQSAGCFRAWGQYATAALATGDHATVDAVYAAHLDLDPNVARAEAVSQARRGDHAKAEAAWRQYAQRVGPENRNANIGLALSLMAQGRPGDLLGMLEAAAAESNLAAARAWGAALARHGGAAAAAKTVGEHPMARVSPELMIAHAELLALSGQDAAPALEKAIARLNRAIVASPAPYLLGLRATAFAALGKADAARLDAQAALILSPAQVESLEVLAGLAPDAAQASEYRRVAAEASAMDPARLGS